jgi:hypothetical protein
MGSTTSRTTGQSRTNTKLSVTHIAGQDKDPLFRGVRVSGCVVRSGVQREERKHQLDIATSICLAPLAVSNGDCCG